MKPSRVIHAVQSGLSRNAAVLNVPWRSARNAYTSDIALQESIQATGVTNIGHSKLAEFGAFAGSVQAHELSQAAQTHSPILHTHDARGHRVSQIEYHDAYHELMRRGMQAGVHNLCWQEGTDPDTAAHGFVVRGAMQALQYQADPGVSCPLSMTFACVPVLANADVDMSTWVDALQSTEYDPRCAPMSEKAGVTLGMSMTEKQGGSDVQANTTVAVPLDGSDEHYALTGHKWFTSAGMSDAFLTLAKVPGAGLTCFLVPRWCPDGSFNEGFHLVRLKDKIADRSNASSEVEYRGAYARRVGPLGAGTRTIVDMVVHTRLDCTLTSASLQRRAVHLATSYACQRTAFGQVLVDAPAMQGLLADLAAESEASAAVAIWTAQLFDVQRGLQLGDSSALLAMAGLRPEADVPALLRLVVAVAKYYVCKRSPGIAYECLEALGGNGFVRDWVAGTLYCQAPLNSVWEGSGNTIALDALRTLSKGASLPELRTALDSMRGISKAHDVVLAEFDEACSALASAKDPVVAQQLIRWWMDAAGAAVMSHCVWRLADNAAADIDAHGSSAAHRTAVAELYSAACARGRGTNAGAISLATADHVPLVLDRQLAFREAEASSGAQHIEAETTVPASSMAAQAMAASNSLM